MLAQDGIDYVPGTYGYRALDSQFVARAALRARDQKLAYLAVHCHGGTGRVSFSKVDIASHERGYPALLQVTKQVVGALVLSRDAIAGEIWLSSVKRVPLASTIVTGVNLSTFGSTPLARGSAPIRMFDRQARIFGDAGQSRLSQLRVAVVGLGGAGSIASEMLARMGVGEIVLIDPDTLDETNLSRVVGSRRSDLPLENSDELGKNTLKVEIAARSVVEAGLPSRLILIPHDVENERAGRALTECDWIILAADSQRARFIVNAVVHACLIPAIQLGVKVSVDQASGTVGDVFAFARRVNPDSGCLWCNGLIDPTLLQLEVLGEEGVAARGYLGPDAPAPSVISLNGVAASFGVTDMLFSTLGLLRDDRTPPGYTRIEMRTGRQYRDEPRRDAMCPYCGIHDESMFARGDRAGLPFSTTSG